MMKFVKVSLILSILFNFPILYLNSEPTLEKEINIDINNDGFIDKIVVSLDNIKIYRNYENKNLFLMYKYKYEPIELNYFNQYNIIDNLSETILGQDVSSPFVLKYEVGRLRYNAINNIFSKDKFIIGDVNGDNLLDFVIIKEPSIDDSGLYKHLIYFQSKDSSFSNKPDRIIEERQSSWLTGNYYDVNRDGFPDKIEIKYRHFGALLVNTKCILSIYLMDNTLNRYKDEPDMRLVSTGIFYEKSNFIDIDNNGYPDILILDIPKKPKSLEEAISKMLDRKINILLKFYLYKKEENDYPLLPTFVKKINVDILQDFTISLDADFNQDDFKDLLVTQGNHCEKYFFDPYKIEFIELKSNK